MKHVVTVMVVGASMMCAPVHGMARVVAGVAGAVALATQAYKTGVSDGSAQQYRESLTPEKRAEYDRAQAKAYDEYMRTTGRPRL